MIDERARRGFTAAGRYDASRPSYPREAVTWMRTVCALDERSTIVEIGAGTGLMTRLLGPVGRLIAVEPVPEMRKLLRTRVPYAEVIDGTARQLPLPSGIADAVVVAQAFHWFADMEALTEISRVLKARGTLVLIWNVKDPGDAMMEAIDRILAPYRLSSPGFASVPWRGLFEQAGSPLALTSHETFTFRESLTLARLKERVLSTSYIALLDATRQDEVLAEIESLAGSPADSTVIEMRYLTEVFVARRWTPRHRVARRGAARRQPAR
jgi:ubiquinone/menaquinone biosynthesis C-methylase UbiE